MLVSNICNWERGKPLARRHFSKAPTVQYIQHNTHTHSGPVFSPEHKGTVDQQSSEERLVDSWDRVALSRAQCISRMQEEHCDTVCMHANAIAHTT